MPFFSISLTTESQDQFALTRERQLGLSSESLRRRAQPQNISWDGSLRPALFSLPTSLKWVHYIDDMLTWEDLPLLEANPEALLEPV